MKEAAFHIPLSLFIIMYRWLSPSPVTVPGPGPKTAMMMDESLDNNTTLIIRLLLLGPEQHNIFGLKNNSLNFVGLICMNL